MKEIRDIYSNFNLMVQELEATEILQTDFVSNVSHEFKTPISAIEGYATLLQDDDMSISEEQEQYISKILFNTRRLYPPGRKYPVAVQDRTPVDPDPSELVPSG